MELILSNASRRLTNTWGKKENLSEKFQNVSFSLCRCCFLPGRIFNWMDEAVRLGWKCRRFLFGTVFARICIWSVFGFYSSEDARIIHTPCQTGKNTKWFMHSWQPANVQEQTHTHTQNLTSKINRQQAFCITCLLKKTTKKIYIQFGYTKTILSYLSFWIVFKALLYLSSLMLVSILLFWDDNTSTKQDIRCLQANVAKS